MAAIQDVAAASLGRPEPWQLGLQAAATPVAHSIAFFHNFLLLIVTAITVFVVLLLAYVMLRFNAKANPVPSRTTHNTAIEVAWTVVPIVILIAIAIPSFRLLYFQRNIPEADITVKITGNKWYWSYEYPDQGGLAFDSNIRSDADALAAGEPRQLAVDNPMVVPVNKTVRIIVTASDVIHAWTIPSFGSKIDAVPGRLNEDWFKAEIEGVYYGQCSELCGKDHAFMPITVRAVSEADFAGWLDRAKTGGIDAASRFVATLPGSPAHLADSQPGGG
ncbi:MAG: cytochrome c oxidase subunit II [Pseudomonadota bacterium]|nr:cytochrome c oxidase subunit II [Pseudomonadota bacterium]